MLSKRLEKGTFENNKSESLHAKINITWTQLMCIMQGIKLSSIRYKKRYQGFEKINKILQNYYYILQNIKIFVLC
ncbi:MAG: hypothetical protein IPL25_08730 [Saprospiraceae bacterium]|nr:hypothetical protein [Candidatus Vicinibacter affinis]